MRYYLQASCVRNRGARWATFDALRLHISIADAWEPAVPAPSSAAKLSKRESRPNSVLSNMPIVGSLFELASKPPMV